MTQRRDGGVGAAEAAAEGTRAAGDAAPAAAVPGAGGREGASPAAEGPERERAELLALCTEAKRLARAARARVRLVVGGPDLYVAAVGNYNVVIDPGRRRVQHGCRDFLGQARRGMLCKHVAALLLAIAAAEAVSLLRGITDPDGGWHLEVIAARGFSRRE